MHRLSLSVLQQIDCEEDHGTDRKIDQNPSERTRRVVGAPQLVDCRRNRRSPSRRVADEHTGRAVFAQRPGERKDGSRQNSLTAGRHADAPEYICVGQAERHGGIRQCVVKTLKRAARRPVHQRKRHNRRRQNAAVPGHDKLNAVLRQKSAELRHTVQTALERNRKKYDLQQRQLKDTEKRDKFRVYGELINTYGYGLEPGAKELTALNYYTGETVKIPLDDTMTPQENAKKYFDRYGKLKRTFEALTELTKETREEIEYLDSVMTALDIAVSEEDLTQIKEELRESGFVKKRGPKDKRAKITSTPFHYLSSDGYHIYVGKNNLQNEELTFRFASGNDLWFHAKGIPGSHVIVKSEGKSKEELPDRLFEEAAALAAYYSKGRGNDKVEIDYVEKKQVKKVNGAKPGFVIYHTNYSMVAAPCLSGMTELR